MRFFSGFGFRGEKALFKEYLDFDMYNLAGFSYGAQKALQEAVKDVKEGKRVQKLQLLSPAFFNTLPKRIKLKELENFVKNKKLYMDFFYKKAAYPYRGDITPFKAEPELSALKELLFFIWRDEDLRLLKDAGVEIEVYQGDFDKIVNPKEVEEFFAPFASLYMIKGVGHLLR